MVVTYRLTKSPSWVVMSDHSHGGEHMIKGKNDKAMRKARVAYVSSKKRLKS